MRSSLPLLTICLALAFCPSYSTAASSAPPNSHATYNGWECDRGYRQVGNSCQTVQIPANAHLDILGHNWECDRGFRQAGPVCGRVAVPINAHLDILGHGWECNRGFKEVQGGCKSVMLPPNAHLDILGHNWECDRGFRGNGPGCQTVLVPEHAHLDILGHDFECDEGYKRVGPKCAQMSTAELEAQRLLKEAMMKRYAAGIRSFSVSGDCDGDSVTGVVEGHKGSKDVTGRLEYDNGHEVDFEGEWTDSDEIEGNDEFGNHCRLEVQ